jgi:hypothetical protein
VKVKEVVTEGWKDLASQFAGGLAGKSADTVEYEKQRAAEKAEEERIQKAAKAKGMSVPQYLDWLKKQPTAQGSSISLDTDVSAAKRDINES